MSGDTGMVSPIAQKVDRVAVLAIAYHNIGVEQEFLKRLDQSLHSYRKGVEIAGKRRERRREEREERKKRERRMDERNFLFFFFEYNFFFILYDCVLCILMIYLLFVVVCLFVCLFVLFFFLFYRDSSWT